MKTSTTPSIFPTGSALDADSRARGKLDGRANGATDGAADGFSRALRDAPRADGAVTVSVNGREARLSMAGTIAPSSLTGRELLAEGRDGSVSVWTPSRSPLPGVNDATSSTISGYDVRDVSNPSRDAGGLFSDASSDQGIGIRLDRSMLFARAARTDPDPSGVAEYDLYFLDGQPLGGSVAQDVSLTANASGGVDVARGGSDRASTVPADVIGGVLERLTKRD